MLEFIIKPTINWMLVIMAKNEHEVKNDFFGFGDKNVAFAKILYWNKLSQWVSIS